jgi:ABC-2 type transport system ATP-binding protein
VWVFENSGAGFAGGWPLSDAAVMTPLPSLPVHPLAPADKVMAVQTQGLSKTYRSGFWLNQRIASLRDCSLTVFAGETFGLLGPNGAGKTTLLKILLGIVPPSGGTATVLGYPLGDRRGRGQLGYLPENPYFYDFLTGAEFLQYSAGLFGRPLSVSRQHQLLDLVGLSRAVATHQRLRYYSKGMLQRIGMAQALVNDPQLVFLDEPMAGLDPTGRVQVREIILTLQQQGKTIFLNSHILSDVELICDRIAILNQGELICSGSLHQLLGPADHYLARGQGGDRAQLQRWLSPLTWEGDHWSGQVQGDPYGFAQQLPQWGARLVSLQQARPSLEEFFMAQVGRVEG